MASDDEVLILLLQALQLQSLNVMSVLNAVLHDIQVIFNIVLPPIFGPS